MLANVGLLRIDVENLSAWRRNFVLDRDVCGLDVSGVSSWGT